MSTLPLTRSKHLIPISALSETAGEPVESLFTSARLPTNCLEDPETPIPSHAAFRFREPASRAMGLPNSGLDATRHLQISDLGTFGGPLLQAPTLHRMLMEFRHLANTQTTMAEKHIDTHANGDVSFCHRLKLTPETGLWHSDMFFL